MHAYQRLAGQMLRRFGPELYPETLIWTHPQRGQVTCRCGVRPLSELQEGDRLRFQAIPAFDGGTGVLAVHPDDPRPHKGSTTTHTRFGQVKLLDWGPEAYWTQARQGAVSWTS